jgi:hypothetical protein
MMFKDIIGNPYPGWPVLFQIIIELVDSNPVNSRTTLIRLHPSQCFLQVLSITNFPPSLELFQLRVRVHASSTAIQSLFFPLRGSPVLDHMEIVDANDRDQEAHLIVRIIGRIID